MTTNATHTVVLIAELGNVDQGAPKRIQILPAGRVRTTKGELLVDAEAARLVQQAMSARGVDVMIDYEHQSEGGEFAAPDGTAVASGWIKSFGFTPEEGLFADVEWTARGAERVAAREYRYISPVALFDPATRRVQRIRSAALVNRPATLHARPLVLTEDDASDAADGLPQDASSHLTGESKMKNQLIGVLALKADASDEEVVSAVRAAHDLAAQAKTAGQAGQTLTLVCKAAGVAEDLPGEKIQAAVMVLAQKAKDHDTLKAEVDRLHAEALSRDADTLIATAKGEGKLVEAQETWARELILKDRAAFESWAKTAPIVRPQGKTPPPPAEKKGEDRDRNAIIATARSEFTPEAALLCSERAFINDALRTRGLPSVSDEEARTLVLKE